MSMPKVASPENAERGTKKKVGDRMTDSKKLREIIDLNGYKLSFVAAKLGLTRNGLMNKINNITDFTIPEVQKLCKLLHIQNLEEIEAIFFALDVD